MSKDPRIIVALDFSSETEAMTLVDKLDPRLCRLKVGITMFTQYGPAFVEALMKKGFSIFLDLKFHDIPHQVAGACRSAAEMGVWMLTIHTLGGPKMCEVAADAISGYSHRPKLVGVTILTSSDQDDL
ncbi:MAG: orotidine-5'-phosphate decarboxylase, partial [Coxiellaceae bacterium]|nr:orotidine-5'-phosphate decarboxylase [Coxiellaceae bacterium]